jgi:hypothetical protein
LDISIAVWWCAVYKSRYELLNFLNIDERMVNDDKNHQSYFGTLLDNSVRCAAKRCGGMQQVHRPRLINKPFFIALDCAPTLSNIIMYLHG